MGLIEGDILWSEFADEMADVPAPPPTKFRPGLTRFAGDSKKAAQLDEARTRMLGATLGRNRGSAFDMPGIPGGAETLPKMPKVNLPKMPEMPKVEMPNIEMPKMPWD